MKIIKILYLICVFILIAVLILVFRHTSFLAPQSSKNCEPVVPLLQSKALIDQLDQDTRHFASTSVDVMGRSTEGGTQTNYTDDSGARRVIEQQFYGETGRAYMRFYFQDNVIFAIVKLNTNYVVPINVDPSAKIKDTEEKDFYLDERGHICSMAANGKFVEVSDDTQAMIHAYIAGVQ